MKKFAVVGHPLHHTLSPAMFGAAFKFLKLDYQYLKEDVEARDLKSVIDKYDGLSVTIPYKEEIIKYLDALTPEAKIIGAVNTVYKINGKTIGHNTDWIGFQKALTEAINIRDKKILIYGAGGAARAYLYALNEYKSNVFITNRMSEKGLALAKQFEVKFIDKNQLPAVDVFINATSIGITNDTAMLVPTDWLKHTELVFDLLYGETLLSKTAKDLGIKTVDSKKMLLYQAIEQFKLFTGLEAPAQIMAKAINLE